MLKTAASYARFSSIFFILILAYLVTRFIFLAQVPDGMTWDEAAIGYNGYAILHQRRDEWLEKLPISFRSFGDYKAPFAIYMSGISTFVFGMNLWAVRFPFVIFGLGAVVGMYLLLMLVFKENKYRQWLSLGGMFLLITSPWHHHFSRLGFESGLAVSELIWAITFWLASTQLDQEVVKKYLKNKKVPISVAQIISQPLFFQLLAVFNACLSLYTYHSSKVTVPLLFVGWAIMLLIKQPKLIKSFLISGGVAVLFLLPLLKDSLYGHGLARAGSSWLDNGLSFPRMAELFITNTAMHLSPNFLLYGQTDTLRHGSGVWGILSPLTLVMIVIAIIVWLKALVTKKKNKTKDIILFGLILVFVGLVPAIIGEEIPHPNRALLALPGFILLAVCGALSLFEIGKKITGKYFITIFIILELMSFGAYLNYYYVVYPSKSVEAFNQGYYQALQIAAEGENGNLIPDWKPQQIIVSSRYGQSYIYALFARKTMPINYQQGSLNRYKFVDTISMSDYYVPNTLIVATAEDILPNDIEPIKEIVVRDGTTRFLIYRSKDQ